VAARQLPIGRRAAPRDREDLPVSYWPSCRAWSKGAWPAPRVYAIAVDFIAHTDARLDRENLVRYVEATRRSAPLTIGELWAIPIMLRLALVENLRRLARQERARASSAIGPTPGPTADRPGARAAGAGPSRWLADLATSSQELDDGFVVQLVRGCATPDAPVGQAFAWIDERLGELETSVEEAIRRERNRQAVNQSRSATASPACG